VDEQLATQYEAVADAIPEAPALIAPHRRCTWGEFEERSARLAGALQALGIEPGAKVAAYLFNGPAYLELAFAGFKARAVHANVNYRYLDDELAYLLENSDAEVLFFSGSLGEHVAKVRDRLPLLRAVVQVDEDPADHSAGHLDGALRFEDLIASHDPAPRVARSGDDLYFLYTGGTTGMPKGVMWRHEDLYAVLGPPSYLFVGQPAPATPEEAGAMAVAVRESGMAPVHLPASPLMHGTGFFSSLQTLLVGGAIATMTNRNFDAHELWQTVQREKVTQLAIVGDAFAKPMVRALEEAEARGEPYDLSSLRLIISSGVMFTQAVKDALLDRQAVLIIDSLGSSEAVGMAASTSTRNGGASTASFQIGASAKVFTEDGREVAPGSGERGLLAVGGPIPVGYYKDPEKTARTFREFGGVRYSVPGDFATVDADGTVHLLGRGSVCINTGGEKVYPEEVEEVLKQHPAVADCVVVGVPDEKWGEAVTGVVALRAGVSVTGDDIVQAMRDRLAGYKRPKQIVIVDEVVRGPAGKLDYGWATQVARERLGAS
jgi:fatty-acyl-CoA synthase